MRGEYGALFGMLEPPNPADITAAPAMLGRALFWATRASANGQIACASCHTVWTGHPTGDASRSTPAAQAEGSLTGSMGFAAKGAAVARLKALGYEAGFQSAFLESLTGPVPDHYAPPARRP